MPYITRHGKKRIKQRLGKKVPLDVAEKALKFGLKHEDATGSLKRYFDALYLAHGTANNTRIYKHKVFIFNGDTLITVLELPHCYIKYVDKLLKKKESEGSK